MNIDANHSRKWQFSLRASFISLISVVCWLAAFLTFLPWLSGWFATWLTFDSLFLFFLDGHYLRFWEDGRILVFAPLGVGLIAFFQRRLGILVLLPAAFSIGWLLASSNRHWELYPFPAKSASVVLVVLSVVVISVWAFRRTLSNVDKGTVQTGLVFDGARNTLLATFFVAATCVFPVFYFDNFWFLIGFRCDLPQIFGALFLLAMIPVSCLISLFLGPIIGFVCDVYIGQITQRQARTPPMLCRPELDGADPLR